MTIDPANEHVRALLHALGDEPAPAEVVDRLERVLAAHLPAALAPIARPRRLRRPLLAIAAPLLVAGAVAFAIVPRSSQTPSSLPPAAAIAESSKGAAPAAGAAPSASTDAGSAQAMGTASDLALAAAADLAAAARAAYAAVEAALHAAP